MYIIQNSVPLQLPNIVSYHLHCQLVRGFCIILLVKQVNDEFSLENGSANTLYLFMYIKLSYLLPVLSSSHNMIHPGSFKYFAHAVV